MPPTPSFFTTPSLYELLYLSISATPSPLVQPTSTAASDLKDRSFSTNIEMGACGSCDSRSGFSTAKLILQDGQLLELAGPVRASELLEKNPAIFVCDSDELDFDEVVSAVGADEFLNPGQLYFVLPLNRLNRPLPAAEMAALAVKASVALGERPCVGGKLLPAGLTAVESEVNMMKTSRKIGGRFGSRTRKSVKAGSGIRRRNTAAVLSVIPE